MPVTGSQASSPAVLSKLSQMQRFTDELSERAGVGKVHCRLADGNGTFNIQGTPWALLKAYWNILYVEGTQLLIMKISQNLLESLSAGQLKGAVAHELSHTKLGHLQNEAEPHRSIPAAWRTKMKKALKQAENPALPKIAALHPFVLSYLHMVRKREFQADREAARLLGSSKDMISALHAMSNKETQVPAFERLLKAHPTIAARIRRLEKMKIEAEKFPEAQNLRVL